MKGVVTLVIVLVVAALATLKLERSCTRSNPYLGSGRESSCETKIVFRWSEWAQAADRSQSDPTT